MADIILGNNFKIYYNTDTGNSSLQGVNNVLIDNLAAFPTFTISSIANQFDTYDSDYLTTLLSEQTLEPLSISIYYVPDNSTAMFLDEMAESHDEFQLVMVYDFDTSAQTISGAIVNGRISSYTTSGDKDEVLTRTYTFIHSDVVMRAMTVTASVPIYQGDYGIGSNTTDIAQYQPDVPTGNSFIKVPAAQVGNPTGTDLMGIGLVDGTNVAEFAMTKSGTLSLFAKNANTAWTRIYTVTQMDSTYVPLTRTVNGKPLSGNVVLNASDLAGGTMTGALTVPALTVTGTTTLSGNTAATVVTATSLTSTGSTATDSLSVSGTTALAGLTTAGTINASTLNVSGNTVHTGTTKLNGVTTAGTVNAGATTATSLSVSGDTTHTGTTKLTGVTTAGTVNAGATTATSLSVSGDNSYGNYHTNRPDYSRNHKRRSY
jgi:cytoskeletal protein CcmA (bactofilin family)